MKRVVFLDRFQELKLFLLLWLTQSFSALGSAMTNFALIIWSYQTEGSALTTALLSVCSYMPYVFMSIFAGALSDRWNKKVTMLVCDTVAACCTVIVLYFLQTDSLQIWHLYCLNAVNGLMNTVQQPASDVTVTLLTPKRYYQKVGGLRAFSNSLVNVLTPVLATAFLAFAGVQAVVWFDLATFSVAFLTLVIFIKIPPTEQQKQKESLLRAAQSGLRYLWKNRGILDLILFLAAINLTASIFNAALPALLLSVAGGGQTVLGIINMVSGIAMLVGSVLVSLLPAPKSRVRVICNTLLLSMSTENFFLAFGKSLPVWCAGAVLGWISIPIMSANLDALLRSKIPLAMQGRVYAARNTLQFFTIPLGYGLGGYLVDYVFEPWMAAQVEGSLLLAVFGSGKGSGASLLFFFIAVVGVATCLLFRMDKQIWQLEQEELS